MEIPTSVTDRQLTALAMHCHGMTYRRIAEILRVDCMAVFRLANKARRKFAAAGLPVPADISEPVRRLRESDVYDDHLTFYRRPNQKTQWRPWNGIA